MTLNQNTGTSDSTSGIIVGLLLLSILGVFLDAVTSFRPAEPAVVITPLALALGLMAVLPVRSEVSAQEKPRSEKPLWLILGIFLSVAVATTTIRDDVRSWFLVALVVSASFLLSTQREP